MIILFFTGGGSEILDRLGPSSWNKKRKKEGDTDKKYTENLALWFEENFSIEFKNGKFVIISPPENFYPDFHSEIQKIISNKEIYTNLIQKG